MCYKHLSVMMANTQEIALRDTQPLSQGELDSTSPTPTEGVLWGFLIWNKLPGLDPIKLSTERSRFVVGRNQNCDVMLHFKNCERAFLTNVSREHFTIQKTSDPNTSGYQIIVEDLSSNGTYINGKIVGKGRKCTLSHGDEIGVTHKKENIFTFLNTQCNQLGYPSGLTKNYIIGKLIGKGSFGEVHLAYLKLTCKKFAVKSVLHRKKYPKEVMDPLKQLMHEAEILVGLKHPCVVKVENIIYEIDSIHLILELMEGGDLLERVQLLKRIPESTAKYYFIQIALAVEYFHKQGIVHRDLKPENILLSSQHEDAIIKVTDFGLSKLVDEDTSLKTYCGTPCYVAPEVLEAKFRITRYTNACDVWSMGVILFLMLAGYHPFMDPATRKTLEKLIRKGRVNYRSDRWSDISPHGQNLVNLMLQVDSLKRPTISEIFSHAWLDDSAVSEKVQTIVFNNQMPCEPLIKRARYDPLI